VSTANDPWGRVDDDGTVYVRTAGGEREVGSWQAGSPDEALAFFKRKFASLETEIALLEQRITTTDLSPAQAQTSIERLIGTVKEARAVGDLDGLAARLEALTGTVDHRREEVKAAREQARTEAREIKERIVTEAERIVAEATHWKISGERMRQLLEEWKAAPHTDRAVETALWKRFSAARNAFTKRRKAYFAGLEGERESARIRKEKLVAQAEELADSTDWGPTASAFRDLMRQWKEAGRAGRADEDALWSRFKAAQDQFFQARSAVYSAKEAELRGHAKVKEQLLAEAEALLPANDLRSARTAMRSIQERWEKAGSVPREARERLESGLRRVEDALRKAEDTQWRRSNPEALARAKGTVAQIKTAIEQLDKQIAKARERGDTKAEADAAEALAARQAWLAEAERTLAEFSS
jgi:outer membrane murein-binding lipoprotein Lpp